MLVYPFKPLKCIYENRWNNYFTQNNINNVLFKVIVKELDGCVAEGMEEL